MKRYCIMAVLLSLLLVADVSAVQAQRFVGPYRTYYAPSTVYGPSAVYAPSQSYWNGYYATPGPYYRPYASVYSYPSTTVWTYPRTYGFYRGYTVAPGYYYGY